MRLTILHTNDIHSNFENFSKIVNQISEWKDCKCEDTVAEL
jgi:2',3'-cyclic-nucleotide 2'-phosphodiesterase (5'-nucleotidase family)